MVRNNITLVLIAISFAIDAQTNITSTFQLKWKSEIGITTYRTNICEQNGSIFVGSNGTNANTNFDKLDGVHQIDALTGKSKNLYKSQLLGDNDATGIALDGNKLFFGTDNYYFYCFNTETKEEVWKFPTEYDVESVPVLGDLNQDGIKDVVFSVQKHGFYALDGKDGSVIWHQDSIQSHQGNVAPLMVDCNKDGVLDVVTGANGTPYTNATAGWKMAHYGDYHIAFNGKDGKTLWCSPTGAGIHPSPFLFKGSTQELLICGLDAYGEFQILDLNGNAIMKTGFGFDHYMSPVVYKNRLLLGDYSVDISLNHYKLSKDSSYKYLTNEAPEFSSEIKGRVSATTMVADVLGLGSQQFISVSESGNMIIRSESGAVLKNLTFPGGAEASVFIKDIDNDGFLEIVIASLNGNLYCYETKSKGEVFYGQFRWNNCNSPTQLDN